MKSCVIYTFLGEKEKSPDSLGIIAPSPPPLWCSSSARSRAPSRASPCRCLCQRGNRDRSLVATPPPPSPSSSQRTCGACLPRVQRLSVSATVAWRTRSPEHSFEGPPMRIPTVMSTVRRSDWHMLYLRHTWSCTAVEQQRVTLFSKAYLKLRQFYRCCKKKVVVGTQIVHEK